MKGAKDESKGDNLSMVGDFAHMIELDIIWNKWYILHIIIGGEWYGKIEKIDCIIM